MTDYRKLLQILAQNQVLFILIGGAAAIAHGSARLTEDLDIVYERSLANIKRMVASLAPYHPYLRGVPPGLPFLWDAETIQRGLNFMLTTPLGDIDLFGEIISGGTYQDLLPHIITLEVFKQECQIINLSRLIEIKRATGRPKDLQAIAELESIRKR